MRKKIRVKSIDFDEVISDSISVEENQRVERPISRAAFAASFGISAVVVAIFAARMIFLAGIEHDRYARRAEANTNQEIPIIAPRGIIADRYGNPLVENRAIFSVFLNISEMARKGEEEKVFRIGTEILGVDRDKVMRAIHDTNLEDVNNVILARDITREQVIAVKSANLSSLAVESDFERVYIDPAFSHVVGYVGLVGKEDLAENELFVLNDVIGRAGLERFYDSELRGENGAMRVFRNAKGEVEGVAQVAEAHAGNSLKTTIDAELQKYLYASLRSGLARLGRTSGAGIAINPQNGEILALVSMPTFDGNDISDAISNKNQPLFNRAVSGLYSPGSTIKPLHAAAALHERVVSPDTGVYSAGFIEIPNPYNPSSPSRFLDWKAHGWVDVHSALARSSNIYFYATGGGFDNIRGLGINKLREYWEMFGLNRKTGIDLPGESAGFLPSPDDKERRTGSIWRIGDTYNVSIGQGDFMITPIELISAISAISNGGIAFEPHIYAEKETGVFADVSGLENSFLEVRRGMEDAVTKSYGTAHTLNDLPVSVAAKTGSAQTAGNTKTNALFVGYAPIKEPEIAVMVLIEDAREGSLNAVPIAKDVFGWYYKNRIENKSR